MADYKELLRRAVSALPENNGAARRAVYEKARSALVGQLRAITPPLPARDITQHRLQLEDCIRQVEQEASEAVISLGRDSAPARPVMPASSQPLSPPVAESAPTPVAPVRVASNPPVAETTRPAVSAEAPARSGAVSIEDIISQAAETAGAPVTPVSAESATRSNGSEPSPTPVVLPRLDAAKAGPGAPVMSPSGLRANDASIRQPSFELRREPVGMAANGMIEPARSAPRIDPLLGSLAAARDAAMAPVVVEAPAVEKALSSVREVDVEADPSAAQGVIERAIETLDREARGESSPAEHLGSYGAAPADSVDDSGFADVPPQRGGSGLTIFLVVFALLLAGVGGGGFWAWREGFVDLDQMFGQAPAPVAETAESLPTTPTLDPVESGDTATGPGNTAATSPTDQPVAELSGLQVDDRLEPTPEPVQPTGTESVLPSIGTGEVKTEERLPGIEASTLTTDDPAASVDPAVLAGSQSLLLEASTDGITGAVPFSGTVEWSEGVDELGLPTLLGTASIPARNLGVEITIRKNSDPSLPASHLMEVDFRVSDTFIGGNIANLPGILLKDEELVPGTALVGASARVVGNSFLFALSATPADATSNTSLLEDSRWMDLAVVYGTGRNAIITLEKDETAQALFEKVFTTWAQ